MLYALSRTPYGCGEHAHTMADLRRLGSEGFRPFLLLTMAGAVKEIARTEFPLYLWCADDVPANETDHQVYDPTRPLDEIEVAPFPYWHDRPNDLVAVIRMMNAMRETDDPERAEPITPLALGAMESSLGVEQTWWVGAVSSLAMESEEFRNAVPRLPTRSALAYLRSRREEISKHMPPRSELPPWFNEQESELPAPRD